MRCWTPQSHTVNQLGHPGTAGYLCLSSADADSPSNLPPLSMVSRLSATLQRPHFQDSAAAASQVHQQTGGG